MIWHPLGRDGRSYQSDCKRWTINRLSMRWELWDRTDPDHPTYHDTRRAAELWALEHIDARDIHPAKSQSR